MERLEAPVLLTTTQFLVLVLTVFAVMPPEKGDGPVDAVAVRLVRAPVAGLYEYSETCDDPRSTA